MIEKIKVLGANIANLTIDEIVEILIEKAKMKQTQVVYTPNSEMIEIFRVDKNLMKILNSADLLSADGIGVVYGAKILGTPLKGRAAGFDIGSQLLEKGGKDGLKFFFFGAKEDVCTLAKQKVEEKYPDTHIVGLRSGYFNDEDTPNIIAQINRSGANVIFVCLGAPKQEKWIYDNKEALQGKIMLGLGGSLDGLAGTTKRAPDVFIKLNLEWLYRLLKQPSRFIRMLALPRFLLSVIKESKKNSKN